MCRQTVLSDLRPPRAPLPAWSHPDGDERLHAKLDYTLAGTLPVDN
ncbi:hypothetical protein [Nonomuraea sp. NPDC003804]